MICIGWALIGTGPSLFVGAMAVAGLIAQAFLMWRYLTPEDW